MFLESTDTVAIKVFLWKGDVLFLKTKSLKPQSELELVVLWAVSWLERQCFTISDVTTKNQCQIIEKKTDLCKYLSQANAILYLFTP